jgi:tyrosinase
MRTEVTINGSPDPAAHYIGWAPTPAQVRLTQPDGATNPVAVRLSNQNMNVGGQAVFWPAIPGTPQPALQLNLPVNGSPVDFFVGGLFGRPSTADRDAAIEVIAAGANQVLSITQLMVRIRKNANTLTTAERNRFRSAMATLNDRGLGRFSNFRNMHTSVASPEAHGAAGFLPWHRAYLLDLERELQQIDPSVALPYWRFDQPAPKVFTREFLGVTSTTGAVQFSTANPLQFWATDQSVGIVRRPQFNTQTQFANAIGEAATLTLGGTGNRYQSFINMEGNPHGNAHVSFTGFMSSISTAARDPLFFLLHANVDRLWAKWQWFNRRFDPANQDTYHFPGSAGAPGAARIGHNLDDTMWPWNQVTGSPRPPTAPGGAFPASLITSAPGPSPTVGAMIDYQGLLSPAARLGFDYDDVPFEV